MQEVPAPSAMQPGLKIKGFNVTTRVSTRESRFRTSVIYFCCAQQPRAQVKRLEMGPWSRSVEFQQVFRKVSWPTEEMTYFYIAYQQQLMGVKIDEMVRIEWFFEDVQRVSVCEGTADNGHSLSWLWIQLNKPPLWTSKADRSSRTAKSWARDSVRSAAPPAAMQKHFDRVDERPDLPPSDGRSIHLALHPVRKTWESYFAFPVRLGLFSRYDASLAAELAARGPRRVAPFAAEPWHRSGAFCANCDNGATAAAVHCLACDESLCPSCDAALHRRAERCEHRRLALGLFAEAVVAAREAAPPCRCGRGRTHPCPCHKERLFCSPDCLCGAGNPSNYGDAPEPGNEAPEALPALPLPKRLRKRKTAYRDSDADNSLGRFVVLGSKRGRDEDDEEDQDDDE